MKKFILLLLSVTLLSACSNDATASDEVISSYPETVRDEIATLPEKIQKNIAIPAKLPTESYKVQFFYDSNPLNDPNGNIVDTTFIYGGGDPPWNLQLTTWHGDSTSSNNNSTEKVTLDNGIEAEITGTDDDNVKEIKWENENGKTHSLTLLELPDTEPQYTVDDLIGVANSME